MATKTTSGVLGLVAYPAQGVSKSIRASVNRSTKKLVAKAKYSEGEWLLREALPSVDHSLLIAEFEALRRRAV